MQRESKMHMENLGWSCSTFRIDMASGFSPIQGGKWWTICSGYIPEATRRELGCPAWETKKTTAYWRWWESVDSRRWTERSRRVGWWSDELGFSLATLRHFLRQRCVLCQQVRSTLILRPCQQVNKKEAPHPLTTCAMSSCYLETC